MKNKAGIIFLIVILSIISITLLGIMIVILIKGEGGINIKLFNNQTSLIYEKELEIEEINDLKINMTSSDINIKESTDGKIRINIYGIDGEKITESFENNILELSKENNIITLFGIWCDDRVDIYIPKNYEKDLHLNTTSGDINVIDLEKANVEIKASSGDVICGNIMKGNVQTSSGDIRVGNSSQISVKASSGDIEIKDSMEIKAETSSGTIKTGSAQEIDIKTTSGDIEVNNVNRIIAQSTSGDINISEIKEYSKIKSTSGSIKIGSYAVIENSNIETTSGKVSLVNNCDIYYEADSISGSIDIDKNNRMSEIVCNIKTTSGNINVK